MRSIGVTGLAVAASMLGFATLAQAADMSAVQPVTIQTETPTDRQWTLTLGGYVTGQPEYLGSGNYEFGFMPIISIDRANELSRFSSFNDSPSIALFNVGTFELGPVANMIWKRDEGDSSDLRGLGDIDYAFEVGGYLQFYPLDWLRFRTELRYGFGGYEGVVADFALDAIHFADYWGGLTVSGGPRLKMASSGFVDTYFGITPEQSATAISLGNDLAPYQAGGGVYSVGVGGQIMKRFNPNITGSIFAEYEYLTGDAADSPLVVQNGDRNQFQAGVSLSYTFFLGIQ